MSLNKHIQQFYYTFILGLLFVRSVSLCAQNTFECDYYDNSAIIVTSTGTAANGFSTVYALTDVNHTILQTSTSASFTPVTKGQYYIYAYNYQISDGFTGYTIGADATLVSTTDLDGNGTYCIDISTLLIEVCPTTPSYFDGEIDLTVLTNGCPGIGYTTVYVITDEEGIIVNTNSTPTFDGLPAGAYRIQSICYLNAEGISGLTIGLDIANVIFPGANDCGEIGTPISFVQGIDIDQDNDGITDIYELYQGDHDGDGIKDYEDADFCAATFTSGWDCSIQGLPDPDQDMDNDGIPNWQDSDFAFCGGIVNGTCSNFDFDGDGVPNHLDLDSDNDGVADIIEFGLVDANGDGMIDSIADIDADGLIG